MNIRWLNRLFGGGLLKKDINKSRPYGNTFPLQQKESLIEKLDTERSKQPGVDSPPDTEPDSPQKTGSTQQITGDTDQATNCDDRVEYHLDEPFSSNEKKLELSPPTQKKCKKSTFDKPPIKKTPAKKPSAALLTARK